MIVTEKAYLSLEKRGEYIDHDRLFKLLIQTFFKEFIEAFFPTIY
ncbi:hypothetical protein ACDX78_20405 [Virgibacillus oceani]